MLPTPERNARFTSRGSPKVQLFGLDFDSLTQQELLERIADAIRERLTCWVATVNVAHLCLAARHPDHQDLLRAADVIVADGMPIVWMSRLRKRTLRERVTGSDLLTPLANRAVREGWRIFLCGGEEGVARRAAQRLAWLAPGLQIAGTAAPQFATAASITDPVVNRPLLKAIREARTDVLLVAFGAPKQERWIRHHLASGALSVPVAIGVGATLDFAAGTQKRAPEWMQRIGLEWFHRMTTQPRRLGPRYSKDLFTFARIASNELLGRNGSGGELEP